MQEFYKYTHPKERNQNKMGAVRYILKDYLIILEQAGIVTESNLGDQDIMSVFNLTYNSKEVTPLTLFVVKGAHFKEEYLKDAIDAGAICYVAEKKYENIDASVPYIIVKDIKVAMPLLANRFHNEAWKRLWTTGITGTKGKSTTCYFIRSIIDDYMASQGKGPQAFMSSIEVYDGVEQFESHLTTPEALEMHKHFENAVNSGLRYVTMEVSSQALKYHRALGVNYDVGIFLNIGLDHISDIEHTGFEDYYGSKLKLMSQCKTAVVNIDADHADETLAEAKKHAKRVLTTSRTDKNADIYAYDIQPLEDGIVFKVHTPDWDEEVKSGIRGIFNVDNALCAIAAAYVYNIPVEFIRSGLLRTRADGRMEIFKAKDRDLTVIVDYAHNKMSMQALFDSCFAEFPGKEIRIVFGSAGGKAFGRRKELGDIAGKYAVMSYLTEEDYGEEPLMHICEDIAGHIEEQGGKYEIILDREEAIKKAISDAGEHAVILVTAKGRETRQKRGIEYIDCKSDVQIVEETLDLPRSM